MLPLLANISYRLNCDLKLKGGDIDKESIINNPEANTMLTRVYRQPYVVPNQV